MNFSKQTSDTLNGLTKIFPKTSIRSYDNKINIANGEAAVTDGLGLVVWVPAEGDQSLSNTKTMLDKTLNETLNTPVFPNYSQTLSHDSRFHSFVEINEIECDKLVRGTGVKEDNKDILLVIKDRHDVSIKTASYTGDYLTTVRVGMIGKYLKCLPKNANPVKAEACHEFLRLTYESSEGKFVVVIGSYLLKEKQ